MRFKRHTVKTAEKISYFNRKLIGNIKSIMFRKNSSFENIGKVRIIQISQVFSLYTSEAQVKLGRK